MLVVTGSPFFPTEGGLPLLDEDTCVDAEMFPCIGLGFILYLAVNIRAVFFDFLESRGTIRAQYSYWFMEADVI